VSRKKYYRMILLFSECYEYR